MSLELREGVYYVRVMVDGKRVQRSTKTGDKKVAEQIHKKLLAELVLNTNGVTKAKVPTLKEAFDAAMRTHWARTKSATTVMINFKTLERILGNPRLDEIGTEGMNKVVAEMIAEGAAPATINRKLALLSKLLKLNEEVLPKLPKVPLQKEYTGRIRYLSETEEEALYEAIRQKMGHNPNHPTWEPLRCLLVVLIDTGMRLGEALKLAEGDVNLNEGTVHVWVQKGDQPRTIPLTDRALHCIKGIPWAGMTKDMVEHRFRTIRDDAKLGPDVVLHTLRHTCASRLAKKGWSQRKIQRWLGHKSIETTNRYTHLDTEDLMDGRDLLQGGIPKSYQ